MLPRLILAVVVPGLLALFLRARFLSPRKGVPMQLPSPPRHWLFGHIFHMPKENAWLAMTKWSKLYDVFQLQILGTSIVVLGTMEAITDLLEKRGSIYSDRPKLTMAGELMGLDQSTGMMGYGPTWRKHRKHAQVALASSVVGKYIPKQEETARMLLRGILQSPLEFIPQLRLATSRMIMSITYGLTIDSADDAYICEIERLLARTSRAFVPGAYLVDLIPALKHLPPWLPFTSFLSEAATARRDGVRVVTQPFEDVKREMAHGRAPPSFTHDLLLALDSKMTNDTQPKVDSLRDSNTVDTDADPNAIRAAEEETIKWTAGSLFGGGSDTTHGVLVALVLVLTLYPAVQLKAQAELDAMLGGQSERLPTLADVTELPYLGALVRELLRWHPVLPFGVARRLIEDDVYKGYHIPAGSTVIPNIWALAYAPSSSATDPPPHVFEPERFLSSNPPLDPFTYLFGFGRRICPGRQLARNQLFIFAASLLAAFRFSPPSDRSRLEVGFGKGLVSAPEPFDCKIEVRSEKMRRIILGKEMEG